MPDPHKFAASCLIWHVGANVNGPLPLNKMQGVDASLDDSYNALKSGTKLPTGMWSMYFSPWCMLPSPCLSHMKVSIPCTCRNILFTGMPGVDFTRDAEESGRQPETGVCWIFFRSTASTKRPGTGFLSYPWGAAMLTNTSCQSHMQSSPTNPKTCLSLGFRV